MWFRIVLLTISFAAACGGGFWLLITPDNWLTAAFAGEVSESGSRVITGPYPRERDFPVLRSRGVKTIVSLLDPRLPYEAVLLEKERALAAEYRMNVLSFPMTSLFGRKMRADYDQTAMEAAKAVASAQGGVYIHCYLGLHRLKSVKEKLQLLGVAMESSPAPRAERSEGAVLLEQAQKKFDAGEYDPALEILGRIKNPGVPARLLSGWAYYRLGKFELARPAFADVAERAPEELDARAGLAYCDLRENRLEPAARNFLAILEKSRDDAAALSGIGIVRYRQGRLSEASRYLRRAIEQDGANTEAKALLARIQTGR
jgi:tetratricopeptide (TPR) repeat protein